jgi:hypothetical protein
MPTTELSDEQKNSTVTFYKNHESKSLNGDKIELGKWSYDATKHLLTMTERKSNALIGTLKVLAMDSKECIMQIVDKDGTTIKMYMIPVAN